MTTQPVHPAPRMFSHLSNAQLNDVRDQDRAAHDWYRFVLSYPPHLVREYLQRFEINSSSVVLDPFCGTGTTVVECKRMGIPSLGIEANPMAFFASSVKTDWSLSGEGLRRHAKLIACEVERSLKATGFDDIGLALFDQKRVGPHGPLRTLPPESEDILLTNSISPIPMHKTLVLLEQILRKRDKTYSRHEQLALAKGLIGPIGNLHFGPEVGVGKPKLDAPVLETWLGAVEIMARDLSHLHPLQNIPCTIFHADSRNLADVLKLHSIGAVVTSPPYPNEKDYTRTTRLESVVLGFIKNKAELKTFKQQLLRSNTRNVFKHDTDDQWASHFENVTKIADAIEARRIQLGKTSGFERLYARVTKLYFGGMARHLAELRPFLQPKAKLAYVVGDQASYLRIMIRTGQLLAEIAESLGYRVLSIDLFRTRLATATREQLREEVLVLEWPGKKTTIGIK